MSRTVRALIFYTFFVVFLITAPILLLSTTGYRYNWKRGRFEGQGALLVKSTPRNARITLNGRLRDELTPALLQLSPNEYQIEIFKTRYHPWRKNLSVTSRQTSFAEDIVLWKEAGPIPLFRHDFQSAAISPDQRLAVFIVPQVTEDAVWIWDARDGTAEEIGTAPAQAQLHFSPASSALLIQESAAPIRQFSVIDLQTKKQFNTAVIKKQPLETVAWGETDGTLHGSYQGTIFALNLFNQRLDPFGRGGNEFFIRGTEIWSIISGSNGKTFLAKSRAGDLQSPPNFQSELVAGDYEFLSVEPPFLLLHDKSRDLILLFDAREPQEIMMEIPGAEVRLRKNQAGNLELLAWNSFELWRAEVRTGNKELLLRRSAPISGAEWYDRGEYFFVASEGRLEAIELDARDNRNVTLLAEFKNHRISKIANGRDDSLLITVSGGSETGLYRLEL
ncbi:PEGA domain-containing protein [Candidatus Uhrbacteria bacterium]|nr:PEGA domain-containing protein [Candidatus Uhrbacteria bacterium]